MKKNGLFLILFAFLSFGQTVAECAFIQGEAMGRPSVVATRIQTDGSVFVGGTAVVVAEGTFMGA